MFTERGVAEFQRMLTEIKEEETFLKKDLTEPPYTEKIDENVALKEELDFKNRYEFGKYLTEIFSDFDRVEILQKRRMWTYLAYQWLESFVGGQDTPRVYDEPKYICREQDNWDLYYRHFVLFPFYAHSLHEEYSKVFLHTPRPSLNTVGDFTEQLASRQQIFNNQELVKILNILYYDEDKERPKKGCLDHNPPPPGGVRRFVDVMRQLRRNYDLGGMDHTEIMKILPSEFGTWVENGD